MFGVSDKINLSIINARDINGKILPISLKLPLNNNYSLPEELASVDIFESQEGTVHEGHVIFSVYVGKVSTIKNIITEKKKLKILNNLDIYSIDAPICIQNVLDEQILFAILNKQDIVVENKEQLIKVIELLSDSFKVVDDSVTKIRTLYKKYDKVIK